MTTNLHCPQCSGHLTVVENGQTERQVFLKETWHVHTFIVARPFVACDACEWVFDGAVRS
jgi:rubredoxin